MKKNVIIVMAIMKKKKQKQNLTEKNILVSYDPTKRNFQIEDCDVRQLGTNNL